jgi:CheY-like chemotaxis protein
MMESTILILEDDPDRCRAFRECLCEQLPLYSVTVFDNAPDTIEWLRDHLEKTALICLDHDLGPNRQRAGDVFDPGTGRDVVDYLATRKPGCPVLIHTTNSLAAPGMTMALEDAGWSWSHVVPYNDLEWVRDEWIACVAECLRASQ